MIGGVGDVLPAACPQEEAVRTAHPQPDVDGVGCSHEAVQKLRHHGEHVQKKFSVQKRNFSLNTHFWWISSLFKKRKLSPVNAGVLRGAAVPSASPPAISTGPPPVVLSQLVPCQPCGHWHEKASRCGTQVPGPQGRRRHPCSQLATFRPLTAAAVRSRVRPFTTTCKWGQSVCSCIVLVPKLLVPKLLVYYTNYSNTKYLSTILYCTFTVYELVPSPFYRTSQKLELAGFLHISNLIYPKLQYVAYFQTLRGESPPYLGSVGKLP
jgi:hypothetical protein